MTITHYYFIEIDLQQLQGTVWINDIPILKCNRVLRTFYQVSEWIVSGENTVRVDLKSLGESPDIRLSLGNCPADRIAGDGFDTLLGQPIVLKELSTMEPVVLHATIDEKLPKHAWQDATLLERNDETLKEASQFFHKIRNLVSERKIDSLAESLDIVFSEVPAVYGKTAKEGKAEFKRRMRWLFDQPDFELEDCLHEDINFIFCANNRLICLQIGDTGEPALRSVDSGNGRWQMSLYIGKRGREWVIYR